MSADDFCIQNLVTSCTDEIIQANIALDRSKTRYASGSNTSSSTSYIGVSRTSTESKAITGIIRYKTTKTDVSPTISVGGVTYTKAGDMIRDPQGSYYLYYTTSTAANPGMPLTSISVSADVFEADCATAMTTTETDVTEIKVGNEVTREGSKATLFGDPTPSSFLHMAYTDTATMIDAIYVGHGKTKKEAQCNLLSLGCNMCIDMDLSKGTKGEFIYIGYTKYTLLRTEKKTGVPTHAVRDIILTVGEEHVKSFTLNGAEYRSAIDEYTIVKGNDGSQAVSLNTGTGGKKIFLYYTTDKIAGATEPIGHLGVSSKDYSMFDSDTKNWEYVFDKNGSRVNVNEGAISTKDDGKHIVDNRIYLYASRNNGDVKSGAAVDPKFVNSGFASFDVYMRGY
ncbi:MAG: hypothetical protein HUJ65_05410 [Oscillospiraceae bacterium]|nr:hypothetical protein [Oscillospiraceae bacterium]